MSMSTEEIEVLYLKHADDFRALIPEPRQAPVDNAIQVAAVDQRPIWAKTDGSHPTLISGYRETAPVPFLIAAMTEAWRERLEREYGMYVIPPTLDCHGRRVKAWTATSGQQTDPVEYAGIHHDSLPEALCAAVAVLAKEKRKAASAGTSLVAAYPAMAQVMALAKAVMCAAKRIRERMVRMWPVCPEPGEIARIIDEELAREPT